MARTREERARAVDWILSKTNEVGVDIGRPDQVLEFMIDHPVPSPSDVELELGDAEVAQKQQRIVALKKELTKLEGR